MMLRLFPIFVFCLTVSHAYSQLQGYYLGDGRLNLDEDGCYTFRRGYCVAYYSEEGSYYVKNDTIVMVRDWAFGESYNKDSTYYELNEKGLFVTKTVSTVQCCNYLQPMLFVKDSRLYKSKSEECPHYRKENILLTRWVPDHERYRNLESNAILTLLNWQVGY